MMSDRLENAGPVRTIVGAFVRLLGFGFFYSLIAVATYFVMIFIPYSKLQNAVTSDLGRTGVDLFFIGTLVLVGFGAFAVGLFVGVFSQLTNRLTILFPLSIAACWLPVVYLNGLPTEFAGPITLALFYGAPIAGAFALWITQYLGLVPNASETARPQRGSVDKA